MSAARGWCLIMNARLRRGQLLPLCPFDGRLCDAQDAEEAGGPFSCSACLLAASTWTIKTLKVWADSSVSSMDSFEEKVTTHHALLAAPSNLPALEWPVKLTRALQ